MTLANSVLIRHLTRLSSAYPIGVSEDGRYIQIQQFLLPPGFNRSRISVLMETPPDYPLSPPGVGNHRLFLPADLRYRGRMLDEFRPHVNPGWGNWAWLCYQHIAWDPHRDDLVTFLEMVRANLTNPPTK